MTDFTRNLSEERGAIGALIIGIIIGAALVIWLLIRLITAIF